MDVSYKYMKLRRFDENSDKMFSWHMLFLMCAGFIVNYGISQLVLLLKVPLYLDNIGSVITAALGGPLVGMTVGFLSNIASYTGDPNSLYFGILTVLIALTSAICSKNGLYKRWWGFIIAASLFMLIGGATGSLISWYLYGGQVGGTISEPFALYFLHKGFTPFWAQFTGDMVVDFADKTITTLALWAFLKFYPKRLFNLYPLSYLYDRNDTEIEKECERQHTRFSEHSIYSRLVFTIGHALVIECALTTVIGTLYYQRAQKKQYLEDTQSAARVAAGLVDGNKIDEFRANGQSAPGYAETKANLELVRSKSNNIVYIYVYQIEPKGCHVVFDLDTAEVPGEKCGTITDFDHDFSSYLQQLFNGEDIPPVVTNGEYGWLFTAYASVKDSAGHTKAYVGADKKAIDYIRGILNYIIRIMAVEFALSVIVIGFVIWYAQRKIVDPITSLVEQTLIFDKTEPSKWLTSDTIRYHKPVTTGDEIQTLYETVTNVEGNVSRNMMKLLEAAELERKNRELAEAVKKADALNEAKTEFYSRMSHDMRTPMNGILGLVQLSKEEKDAAVLHANIHKIGEAGNYLLGLINDTLDISKLESNKLTLCPAPMYAQEFMTSLADMITPSLKSKKINYHVVNNGINLDVWILSDKLRLQQIFANLLSNAIKFTPKGGIVTLTLDTLGGDEKVDHAMFTIRDSGIGMSKDFVSNGLFHPFSQEHNELTSRYAGSGLGLAIVKNLLDLMHGTIEVQSELGEGTTFIIKLDFIKVPLECVTRELNSEESQIDDKVFFGKHILLAEDNDLNAEIATSMLENIGIVVERVANGQEALERINNGKTDEFDLILMDIRMPVMDGITATKLIRGIGTEYSKEIPIIAMTANAYLEDREQTKAAGMNEHLATPIDANLLRKTLMKYFV